MKQSPSLHIGMSCLVLLWSLRAGPACALTLEQAKAFALSANPDVIQAQRNVERAKADIDFAQARPNPNLTVGVSDYPPGKHLITQGTDQNTSTSVEVDQVIERGDKRQHRMDAADNALRASQADLADTRRLQQLAVSRAYWDLKYAQEKVRIGEDTLSLFRESQRAVDLRQKYGDIASADATRLKLDVVRAAADLQQAKADLVHAQWQLAMLAGKEANKGDWDAADPWPALDTPASKLNVDDLLAQRADVHAAADRVAAADAARQLARSLKSHDLTVGVGYSHSVTNAIPNGRWSVSVSTPLFIAYAYEGEIGRAEADYFAAQDAETQVKRRALAEITQAESDLNQSQERLRRYREDLMPMSQSTLSASEYAFKRGAASVLDLLDARRVYRATQLEAAAAEDDYAKSLAAFQSSIQSGN